MDLCDDSLIGTQVCCEKWSTTTKIISFQLVVLFMSCWLQLFSGSIWPTRPRTRYYFKFENVQFTNNTGMVSGSKTIDITTIFFMSAGYWFLYWKFIYWLLIHSWYYYQIPFEPGPYKCSNFSSELSSMLFEVQVHSKN